MFYFTESTLPSSNVNVGWLLNFSIFFICDYLIEATPSDLLERKEKKTLKRLQK